MNKILPLAFAISAVSASLIIGCVRKTEEDTAQTPPPSVQSDTDTHTDTATLSKSQSAYMADTKQSIVGRYKAAHAQSVDLQSFITQACQSGNVSNEEIQQLREQWLTLAKLWSKAEIVNFGAVNDNMTNLYINYYPDNRNVGKKELDALLSTQSNITSTSLKNESAIIQGLSGLEILLFTNEDLGQNQYDYAIANTDLLTSHIGQVIDAWQLPDTALDLGTWANSMLAMLELTKTNAIQKPFGILGKSTGHVPARYAGASKALLLAKLDTLSDALDDENLRHLIDEKSPNSTAYVDVSQAILNAKSQLERMPEDLSLASDEDKHALSETFTQLIGVFKKELMPSLGVQVGFNTSDGD